MIDHAAKLSTIQFNCLFGNFDNINNSPIKIMNGPVYLRPYIVVKLFETYIFVNTHAAHDARKRLPEVLGIVLDHFQ